MKILKSNFNKINTDEIKEYLKNKISFNNRNKSAPELWFYDENEIETGYYDFEINDLHFIDCYIVKHDITEDKLNRYTGESYYVNINLN